MNKQQRTYLIAKAKMEMYEKEVRECEIEFMKNKNIINSDGTKALRVWHIDNEKLFDEVNTEYAVFCNQDGLWDELVKSRDEFKTAEENLLKYAFSIIPDSMFDTKETLEKAVKTNLNVREKIIDLVIRLER